MPRTSNLLAYLFVAAAPNKTTLMTAVRRLWDWRKTVLP